MHKKNKVLWSDARNWKFVGITEPKTLLVFKNSKAPLDRQFLGVSFTFLHKSTLADFLGSLFSIIDGVET